jgi:O-antigen/teichoic acid export membrane protein
MNVECGTTSTAARDGSAIKRVTRGGITSFFIYGAGVGLTYCSQLLIARMVGVQIYGVYAYVYAWMVVLAYMSALGFDVALLRFVPAYEAVRNWPLLCGVIQYGQRRAGAVGLAVVLIGVGAVLLREKTQPLRDTLLVGLWLVPVWALLWIRCSVLRAFGGVISALVPDRVVRDGLLVVLVGLATFGQGWTLDATMVMTATLISSLAGLSLASLGMRRMRPSVIKDVAPEYDAAMWRRTAVPLVIIGAAEPLLNRTGVILLGWFEHTKDAGIYSLVFNIAFVVALPRIAINTLFAPTIASLFARKDQAMLQALVTTAASWTLAASAFIAFVLFVLAEPFLGWFGPGYDAGVPALRILLIAQVIAASAGSQMYVMIMTGHERSAALLLVSHTVVNAALSAWLIGLFGLSGAAIGTGAILVVWNAAMGLYLWRRLHLVPGAVAAFHALFAKAVNFRMHRGRRSQKTRGAPDVDGDRWIARDRPSRSNAFSSGGSSVGRLRESTGSVSFRTLDLKGASHVEVPQTRPLVRTAVEREIE